jgi:hypothetical protein
MDYKPCHSLSIEMVYGGFLIPKIVVKVQLASLHKFCVLILIEFMSVVCIIKIIRPSTFITTFSS